MATSTTATEVAKRGPGRPKKPTERQSFAGSLAAAIRGAQVYVARIRFPNPAYRDKPVDFFRQVLGVEPWHRQVDIINAVRDYRRVAVRSGHKISKSHTAAGIALWFYCSFPDARVIMSSTTARQVDQILWRELRIMRARSGRCTECKAKDPEAILIPKPCPHSTLIEGEQGDLARTGLKAPDFREIVGFTAREAEAVAGISGSNLLYILDEASGIEEVIYEAIAGNMAGGGRVVLFGNPTKNEGEFYAAFHDKKHLYHCITVSSEETPNVTTGRIVIPGLATREWIDEKKDEWGEDSPLYKIRILGQHATHEEGRIFSVHMIELAEQRWEQTPEAGRLFIGIDPAGESGIGDETIMCPRRGLKQLAIQGYRGASSDMLVTHVTRMITALRLPREVPVVVVDAEGPIGIKLCRLLAEYLDQYPDAFELVRVYASHRATRQPNAYERVRDELAANLESWFRDGGAIIEDTRLAAELHSFEWIEQVNGRLKCTPKDTIRKQLQRSPDRYDALALATWEPLSLRTGAAANDNARLAANDNAGPSRSERIFDPYAAGDIWRANR